MMKKNKASGKAVQVGGAGAPAESCSQLLQATREKLSRIQQENLRANRRLRQKNEIFNLLLEKINMMSYEYDVETDHLFYTRMTPEHEIVEKEVSGFRQLLENRLYVDENRQKVLEKFQTACKKPVASKMEFCAQFFEEYRWYRSCYKSRADNDGQIYAIIGYTVNIQQEVAEREQLMESAQRDPLTKLYNREMTERLVNDRLTHLEPGEKGVLFLLDIDNFKKINDDFGHMAGDGFLRAITEAIRADFRGDDVLGRIGGDEFVIFLHGFVSIDAIEKRAQRIIDMFLRLPVEAAGGITCSVGIIATGKSSATYEELVPKADEALYSAKNRGKNRYRLYGEDKY